MLVYPVLLRVEGSFAVLYSLDNGRPVWSVARKLGVLILQGMLDVADQEAVDLLAFDARWQHALDLDPADAYLSRRSLVEFRGALVNKDPEGKLLEEVMTKVTEAALKDLRISVSVQRLDSTRIQSNIASLGRRHLFSETLRVFARELGRLDQNRLGRLPADLVAWMTPAGEEGDGDFGWRNDEDLRMDVLQLATWLVAVQSTFESDPEVAGLESFGLVVRLIDAHITIEPVDGGEGGQEKSKKVRCKMDRKSPGRTLEGPTHTASSPPSEKPPADPSTSSTPAGVGRCAEAGEEKEEESTAPPTSEACVAECEGTEFPGRVESSDAAPTACAAEPPQADAIRPCAAEPVPHICIHKHRPGTRLLQSPHDPDAGYGPKGVGYHAHISETVGNNGVNLITHVEVVPAGIPDQEMLPSIILQLVGRGLMPQELLADGGFTTTEALQVAAELDIDLIAPISRGALPKDVVGRDAWETDPETGRLTRCPEGAPVLGSRTRKQEGVLREFSMMDAARCRSCPMADRCVAKDYTKSSRHFLVEDSPALHLRDARLTKQANTEWRRSYRRRAGVEGTISECKRAHGLGRLRVRRKGPVVTAVMTRVIACNAKRWTRASPSIARPPPKAPVESTN